MNGARFGAYSVLKQALNITVEPGTHNSFLVFTQQFGAAAVSGVFGAVIASPFFLVKIRMQASIAKHITNAPNSTAVGTQRQYRSTWHAFKSILKDEGLKGLARGAEAAALRVAVGSAAQLPSYDQCKYLLYCTGKFDHNSRALQICASLGSGLCVTTAMNPFDVVATRMYNQPVLNGKGTLYLNPLDCLIKIARAEGVHGLFKGYVAHYLRLGPHTVLGFVILEQLRNYAKTKYAG
jgi:solute carrier family 25, member 34/35